MAETVVGSGWCKGACYTIIWLSVLLDSPSESIILFIRILLFLSRANQEKKLVYVVSYKSIKLSVSVRSDWLNTKKPFHEQFE